MKPTSFPPRCGQAIRQVVDHRPRFSAHEAAFGAVRPQGCPQNFLDFPLSLHRQSFLGWRLRRVWKPAGGRRETRIDEPSGAPRGRYHVGDLRFEVRAELGHTHLVGTRPAALFTTHRRPVRSSRFHFRLRSP